MIVINISGTLSADESPRWVTETLTGQGHSSGKPFGARMAGALRIVCSHCDPINSAP
jgi:hypothetical protein